MKRKKSIHLINHVQINTCILKDSKLFIKCLKHKYNNDKSNIFIGEFKTLIRNLFFFILGASTGIWVMWPKIITTKGWNCTMDVVASSNDELTDIESIIESLPNKIKLGLTISPKIILKRENLTRIEKIRVVGDTCFR